MRLIILAVLLSSCSMMHKASSKQMKDSTAVITDNTRQIVKIDSTATSTNKEIETADLVVVFKDTATGFFVLRGDSITIPAQAIKEIRQKRKKQKESDQSTKVTTDQAILTDTRQKVTVKEKAITKDKHVTRISWMWIILIIAAVLLYISRKRIYAIFKALTI
jgi:hypothetical protein